MARALTVAPARAEFKRVPEAALLAMHGRLAELTKRRESSAWGGSLEDADMTRLVSVIENMLLPRMLRAYRPSDGLPLERCLG